MSTQADPDDPHRLADSNYKRAKVGVNSRDVVSITECDLRPFACGHPCVSPLSPRAQLEFTL